MRLTPDEASQIPPDEQLTSGWKQLTLDEIESSDRDYNSDREYRKRKHKTKNFGEVLDWGDMMRYGLLRMLRRRQSLLTPNIPKAKLLHVRTVHWNSWGDEGHLRRQGAASQEQLVPSGGKEQPVKSSRFPQEEARSSQSGVARSNIVSIGASTLTTDVRCQQLEEFYLVTGLKFRVQNLDDYDDAELPIPFRRRVFPSYLDGEHITGNIVFQIIEDELFDRLHDDDAVSLCCLGILQLVLLGVEGKRRIPDWMLWDKRFKVGPHHSRHIKTATPSSILMPSHMGNPNLKSPIEIHHHAAGLFDQNILNRGKREQRPSFYKRSPFMEQPPTTVLPKQRGNKTKNNVKKANLSPLNLGNAFDDDNEGGSDVIFLGAQFTGNYLVYENVDVDKVKRENYEDYM
ncbi:hypothetical protein Tco_0932751 [Tanacetum coccineum]